MATYTSLPKYLVTKIETTSYHAELRDRRQTGPRPQSYHEECCSYEVVQEVCRPKTTEKPPTPKKTWPPVKAIEDITYPTASPLYIDPNPVIDKRTRQVTRERRAAIESVISREHSRRSSLCEPQYYHQHDSEMDKLSCPGPVYRRVELVNAKESRQQQCERSTSRASSADSVRRSLTPTRITQPIPRPWTATVSSGTNVYESSYTSEQENICSSYCGKQECQQEKVCRREQSCEREPPAPPGHRHREQHLHKEEDTCKNEGSVHRHEHKTSDVCKFVCEATPEPEPQPEPQVEQEERVDFSKLVPPDVAICPKGIDAEHDLYTETEEEDKGNMHIKKTTTYEKTVELVSPDREMGPPFGKQDQQTEVVREEYTQRSSTVDREVESISGRRHITETTESLTQKIDTQQMLEEARKQEEEDRKRKEQEERRQREEDERKRQEEERLIAEMRRREEEQKRQKEEAERKRKEEERRRIEQEERERSSSQVCRSERTETYEEEIHSGPRERIIDIQIEDAPCKCASAQVVERPPSRERIIKVEREEDKPCKTQVREVQEEVNIKQHCEHRDYEEQRKRSLREQVEVHQNLREQQAPKRQPSLQERRICSRLSQQSEGQQQQSTCTKKHVQFVKQTESGTCPLPQTPIKNATPKEWKSEMCKALTTASEQPYAPLGINRPSSAQETYTREVTYEQKTVCAKCEAENRPVSPFVQALTTASDRPYSPLGRDVNPQEAVCRCQRSQTPDIKSTYEGYSQPSEILYRNPPKDPPRRPDGPRPLPTPPPDFRFRNRSVSPNYRSETRSRSATPSGRLSACGLKRPDTIPSYQKYLICEEQAPVQSQDFPCSRTSTPACAKSPAPGPPEPPACYLRAQAPRIRDETPPCKREQRDTTTPDKTETVRRHFEEDTPQGHKTTDTISSKTVHWVGQGSGKHAHIEEHDDVITEECDGSHHVKKVEHKLKEYDDPEPPAESPVDSDRCYISQNSDTEPTLPCPTQNTVLERIQRTGVRVFAPTGQPEVRRIVHEIPPPEPEPPCPMTGVQVLPIRAHGDQSCKTGVVVVPCDGIGSRGVCITPTPDRSGVRVSPCPAESGGICKKPSCYCGSTSGKCTNLGNVSTTTTLKSRANTSSSTCSSSGICIKSTGNGGCSISPCPGIPGVRSVQCPKTPPKCLGAAKANLPFPNIPLPEEDVEEQPPCVTCPLASSCVKSTSTSFSTTSESRDCGFQPIHKPQPPQQPRTNLCNQITTLTLCKRETKSPVMPPVPTVQLYKPQPAPPAPPCRSTSQQNRFRRETTQTTTTSCQSQNSRTETQTRCLSSKTQSSVDPPNLSSHPDLGAGGFGGGNKGSSRAGSSAPNRGRGILNQAGSGCRVPLCAACNNQVR